ncbi:MAG: lysophospholipase [Spirochaetales bacterium]|nr:lysophospholipase [Spirochaetales bacterium]
MKKTDFTYNAADGKEIFASKWEPEDTVKPKGLIQIVHGMAEHRHRYDEFAAFLTRAGFICFGEDHRGHGETITHPSEQGFFADDDGWNTVINDISLLTDKMIEEHPDLPVFIYGHSMGSLLSRTYLIKDPEKFAGVILTGTAAGQGVLGKIGKLVSRVEMRVKGPRTPSPLLDKLSFGAFNDAFKPNRTQFDWLSRDDAKVDAYIKDPLCGFICTPNLFFNMIDGVEYISAQGNVNTIPADVPVFIASGASDPVGGMGKGVEKVYNSYLKAGLKDVKMKLYPDSRHEILNETNREEIYADILKWIKEKL